MADARDGFGGMKMEDLDDATRSSLGLGKHEMALRINHVGEYGPHAAAKKEGFKANDILLEVADSKQRIMESALIGDLLQHHRPGGKLPAVSAAGHRVCETAAPAAVERAEPWLAGASSRVRGASGLFHVIGLLLEILQPSADEG